MTRNCPECGDPLVPTADGRYTCIGCQWSGDEDDAPAPTGSPLDIRADAQGRVQMDVPDPRRGMDTRPVRMGPDAARRLAEALEMAADDAERREDTEPLTDGGKPMTPLGSPDTSLRAFARRVQSGRALIRRAMADEDCPADVRERLYMAMERLDSAADDIALAASQLETEPDTEDSNREREPGFRADGGMDWNGYQQLTEETAVYPEDEAVQYLALGLNGEAGEVAEKVKKWRREDDAAYLTELETELGDVLWYLTRMADEIGVDLADVAAANVAKLTDRSERGVITGAGDDR